MLLKSFLIATHCLSRNGRVINTLPLIRAHLGLNDLEVITQTNKHLTILTSGKPKSLCSLTSENTTFLRRGILRLEPLSSNRNRLLSLHILEIVKNNRLQISPHLIFNRSTNKDIKVISTAHLHQIIKILNNSFAMIRSKILQNHTGQTPLTASAANVTRIKHGLESIKRILIPRGIKLTDNVSFTTISHRAANTVKINKRTTGRTSCYRTIFGILLNTVQRCFIFNRINKTIHIFFLSLGKTKTL